MQIIDTPENRALAAVIERDAKVAAGLNLARRACWRAFGLGLCFAGLGALLGGAGTGAQKALQGYAAMSAARESAERAAQATAGLLRTEREELHAMLAAEREARDAALLAKIEEREAQATAAMAAALRAEREELHAMLADEREGREARDAALLAKLAATKLQATVKGEVSLRPGATVGLDPNAARPTPAQIQAGAKPAAGAPIIKTDVVQFIFVPYGKGDVVSASRFADSSQKKPSEQWCDYRETLRDKTVRFVTIAEDGKRVALPTRSPFPKVDLQGAFNFCTWVADAAHAPVAPVV